MITLSRKLLIAAGLAVAVVAVGCQKQGSGARKVSQEDIKEVSSLLADTVGQIGMNIAAPAPLPANVVFTKEDIPNEGGYLQVSIGDVTDDQANQFLRRAKSENCTCGCPHTIDQCLIEDPQCTVAQRLAAQVLKEVTGGI